jgi:hypothetical protein
LTHATPVAPKTVKYSAALYFLLLTVYLGWKDRLVPDNSLPLTTDKYKQRIGKGHHNLWIPMKKRAKSGLSAGARVAQEKALSPAAPERAWH